MTWRVRVQVGALVVESVQLAPWEDRQVDEVPLPALISASWVDQIDLDRWPAVQLPSTGSVVIRFATAAEAAAITATTPVAVELYRQHDDAAPVAAFYGRTSDPDMEPHLRGVNVRLTMVDYLSDLAEHTVGDALWPQEDAFARLDRMFAAAGVTPPAIGAELIDPAILAERPPNPQSLLTMAQDVLSWSVYFNTHEPGVEDTYYEMGELRPQIDPVTRLLDGWSLEPLPRESPGAGAVVWNGAGHEPDPDPAPGAVIEASWCRFGARWSRRRWGSVRTVVVITASKARRVFGGDGLTMKIETELQRNADADLLADYLYPWSTPENLLPGWEIERVTVDLDRTPDDFYPGQLRDVRVLAGVETRHNPENVDWMYGVITSLETRIDAGRCEVDVALGARPVDAFS